jgi:hypothetical protein
VLPQRKDGLVSRGSKYSGQSDSTVSHAPSAKTLYTAFGIAQFESTIWPPKHPMPPEQDPQA